tara:strand:- start:137 stop:1078 length:942 start_codon:yes stop_codon:yes gene_type:complete
MAQLTNTFETYDAVGNREDLQNVIYNISPTDTPFMSSIGQGTASFTKHEWQTDSLAAAAANAQDEGDDSPSAALSATTRVLNYTQISYKPVMVSGTQEKVIHAGVNSELAYQIAKAGKELKRDIELAQTGKVAAGAGSGNGASARTSRGFESWTTTNNVYGSGGSNSSGSVTDGTQRVLTESILKTEIKNCYDGGGDPDLLIVGSFNKQKVSGFTGNSTRMDMAEDRKLVTTIDVYVSDFGEVRVMADRILRSSGRSALVVESSMWSTAYLRPFQTIELAKTGDAEKRLLLAEWTLVAKNEASSATIADLTTS